jgi:hypothetical protein
MIHVEHTTDMDRVCCDTTDIVALNELDLAWEYLRRNAHYRACWNRGNPDQSACEWGLELLEDPHWEFPRGGAYLVPRQSPLCLSGHGRELGRNCVFLAVALTPSE